MVSIERQNYQLSRNYALISFIAVAITSIIIFLFFRAQTINSIESASEESYTALAIAITNSMNDHFIEYYDRMETARRNNQPIPPIHATLINTINRLVADSSIERIKLYDRYGRVIYSTKQSQIGRIQKDNPGFISAIGGKPATKLIYRDTLNIFDRATEDANLAQSYVPIETSRLLPAIGVFEIYADVSEEIAASNRIQIGVLIFLLVVMAALYAILMFFIKKGEKIINEQQRESKERQRTLEILSSKMITAQEDEKRRISEKLHEDVVQTILAVKMHLENCIRTANENGHENAISFSDNIVPILQEAVSKIRSVSIDLRPPSLDNFGLLAATNTLVSDFRELSDRLSIKIKIDITEEELTSEMKSILYRILKDTLGAIAYQNTSNKTVNVTLTYNDVEETIELEIGEGASSDELNQEYFEMMRERTILSGGEFTISKDSMGKLRALSAWDSR